MRTINVKIPLNVDFTPKDVKFPKYLLRDTLGNSEAEEIAARYITICQDEKNEWAGINLNDFIDTLDEDAKNIKEVIKTTYTMLLLDRFRIGGPTFLEMGFYNLIDNGYISWEEQDNETYILPTEKLFKAIQKYVQK